MSKGWGRVRDVAEYTGLSDRTVRSWLKMGLPHSKVGGAILVEFRQLDLWLRSFAVDGNKVDTMVAEFLKDF